MASDEHGPERHINIHFAPEIMAGVYANFANVSHSDYEFTITFARVDHEVEDEAIPGVVGAGRPARRQRRHVTLRCAGRNRMTVLRRELPRTRVASRDRIVPSRVLQRVALVAQPQTGGWSGGGHLLGGQGLAGHGGPEEAGELAGDGDVGDGGALAVAGEVAVAVGQAHLGAEGGGGGG